MGAALLWGAFLTAAGAAAFLFHVRTANQAIRHWPQVPGRVLPDTIVFQQAGWSPFTAGKGLKIVAVSFEYEVEGEKKSGSRLIPVGWTIRETEQDRIRRDLLNFSVVLYNPEDPREAYLDLPDRFQRGSISWITVALILSISLVIFFGALLLTNSF
jgi:hypothetical protein